MKCFQTPGHVFLALLAIVVLAIGLALIPLIFLLVYEKIKVANNMSLFNTLQCNFTDSSCHNLCA